jgi:hypothetical protein
MRYLAFSMLVAAALPAPVAWPAPLPAEFAPVTWESDPRRLGELFPGAKVEQTTVPAPDGRTDHIYSVVGVTHPVFGMSHMAVHVYDSGKVWFIELETRERRAECLPIGLQPAPEYCRWRYTKELVDIFNQLKATLSKQYGRASGTRDPKNPRARYAEWRLQGFRLLLALESGEEQGDWSVNLMALPSLSR